MKVLFKDFVVKHEEFWLSWLTSLVNVLRFTIRSVI